MSRSRARKGLRARREAAVLRGSEKARAASSLRGTQQASSAELAAWPLQATCSLGSAHVAGPHLQSFHWELLEPCRKDAKPRTQLSGPSWMVALST